jgi:hypothetical protein
MPAVTMRFVDAENDQPIAGAHVLFWAKAIEGTFTGHGGKRAYLFLVESVTSEKGEVHFPAQSFSPRPFRLSTTYDNPDMIVFKPGYALAMLTNRRRIIATLEDVETWEPNGRTVGMRRVSTGKETNHSIYTAARFAEATYTVGYGHGGAICGWKTIPQFLAGLDRAVREWKRKPPPVEKDDLRQLVSNPLESLLASGDYYVAKGCGSPNAFFEPYLRQNH